jgi:alkyl sulfatase BDS1-like metallo-beta-lactamase superfamily hydrolase
MKSGSRDVHSGIASRETLAVVASLLCFLGGYSATAQVAPKPPTPLTAAANADVYDELDFSNLQDFDDASRGFIAGLEPPRHIANDNPELNAKGFYAWNLEDYYSFMDGAASPPSVNPSLWRQERLNNLNGLFEVAAGNVYQIRSYDMATMSFIRTPRGWIVLDPLMSRETSRAGLALLRAHISTEPVVAIIVTHSHHDHYNGLPGILEAEQKTITPAGGDLASTATIPFYAPDGFYAESISENLYLGNSMARRADYMYGTLLPRGERGHVGSGLGKTSGFGSGALVPPTVEVSATGAVPIMGLDVYFQMAPGTEAPAEMHVFFPAYGAFCPGENVSHTMHNLLTSRGAKIRDPKAFAHYIDEAIDLFGPQIQVMIGTHHWPRWGNGRCLEMLEKQRDMYRFFNDQVIRMINDGKNMEEIAEEFDLPESLDREFYNRGYYGTKNHNVKAVYQRYVGWWDGNPANYFKYPDEEAAKKYVAFMGGEKAVIAKARRSFRRGDYRWVAEVMKHVVFANPKNRQAKLLQADAFEQLGYSFESGTWRNIFLSAAEELRNGNLAPPTSAADLSVAVKLPPTLLFDFLSTRIMGKQAEDVELTMRFHFTDAGLPDTERNLYVALKNGVLHCKNNKPDEPTMVTYTITRTQLLQMLASPPDDTFAQLVAQIAPMPDRVWNIVLPLDHDNTRKQ